MCVCVCVCVCVPLGIQPAMRCAIKTSMACPDVQYFSTFSQLHDFRKKKKAIEHEICVLMFSIILSATRGIPRRTERDIIKS